MLLNKTTLLPDAIRLTKENGKDTKTFKFRQEDYRRDTEIRPAFFDTRAMIAQISKEKGRDGQPVWKVIVDPMGQKNEAVAPAGRWAGSEIGGSRWDEEELKDDVPTILLPTSPTRKRGADPHVLLGRPLARVGLVHTGPRLPPIETPSTCHDAGPRAGVKNGLTPTARRVALTRGAGPPMIGCGPTGGPLPRAGPNQGGLAVAVQMELTRIIINENNEQQIIFLKEVDGERTFPIVIGIFEATSIDRRVKGLPAPRPLTHDLLASTIELLGGELQDIYISELRDHTYLRQAPHPPRTARSSRSTPAPATPSPWPSPSTCRSTSPRTSSTRSGQ